MVKKDTILGLVRRYDNFFVLYYFSNNFIFNYYSHTTNIINIIVQIIDEVLTNDQSCSESFEETDDDHQECHRCPGA